MLKAYRKNSFNGNIGYMPSAKQFKGKITSWNDEKGFGFITPLRGESDNKIFIHIKSISNRNQRPQTGQLVSYTLSKDKQGRPCADNSVLSSKLSSRVSSLIRFLIPIISAASFFCAVGLAVYMAKIPPFIFVLYIFFSLITFTLYARDKSAARKGNWRTKETSLHLMSLMGGWPGALLAQKIFRHKSRKQPFRTIFWTTTFLNAGVFIWLLTPNGTESLQMFVEWIVWGLTTEID